MVQLSGGNDGLNTVVPYGLGHYYSARPKLAVRAADVLPLNDSIGLNAKMSSLHELFATGQLAILLGVGYPNSSRSHFRSVEIWQTAEPDRILNTGWLGRYLDYSNTGAQAKKVFPAINVDPMLPKSLASDRTVVPTISEVHQSFFNTDIHYQLGRQGQIESFNKIYQSYDLAQPDSQLLREMGMEAMQASHHLLNVSKHYRNSVVYPDNGFGRGMKFIAQMIIAGLNTQIYNISLGGFDTHANQGQTHPYLLQQFSDALAAFYKDLLLHNADQDVLVFTFSEFGRRLKENAEAGTDHGTAAPVLIMGSAVKGGLYGDHPSLNDLDQGDLKYGIDFRSIYATILNRWLEFDAKQILGRNFENILFV